MTNTHAASGRVIAAMRRLPRDGYTLIELLVVLTIISLIVGLVGPRVLGYLGEFYIDTGRYPTSSEGLTALAQRPAAVENWNGPYLKGVRVPLDPWGHAYRYRSPIEHLPPYEIVSDGADGREGGPGAISSVER
jgi:general secretion pathway protein G